MEKYKGLLKRGQADEFLGRRENTITVNRVSAAGREGYCKKLRDFL